MMSVIGALNGIDNEWNDRIRTRLKMRNLGIGGGIGGGSSNGSGTRRSKNDSRAILFRLLSHSLHFRGIPVQIKATLLEDLTLPPRQRLQRALPSGALAFSLDGKQ